MNQPQRVTGKLEDVTGNPQTIAENETFARERDAVEFGPEPAAIGQKIVFALALDHGVNTRDGDLFRVEVDARGVHRAVRVAAADHERLTIERDLAGWPARSQRRREQSLKLQKSARQFDHIEIGKGNLLARRHRAAIHCHRRSQRQRTIQRPRRAPRVPA